MKRGLLKQMINEWKENLWLVLALAIVSGAIWTLGVILWSDLKGIAQPRGFDPENVFVMEVSSVSKESNDYIDYGEEWRGLSTRDLRNITTALRSNPNVEAVAWTANGIPYKLDWWGNSAVRSDVNDTIKYYGNWRYVSPDYALVLKLRSTTGKSSEDLRDMIAKEQILLGRSSSITENDEKVKWRNDMLGKSLYAQGDSSRTYTVGDLIEDIKRTDYDVMHGETVIFPQREDESFSPQYMLVRVKPGCVSKFLEDYDKDETLYRFGNSYLNSPTSLMDMGYTQHREQRVFTRMSVGVTLILMVIIFLGMLGTFWFRMQQRVSEIAIRKVCGATSREIFGRVISEGLILLLFASVVAAAIVWVLMIKYYMPKDFELTKTAIFGIEILTMIIVAIGIVVSVSFPAYKAMKIEPAIAIKDE